MANRYSVYERGTDRPICIYGTSAECAAALGINVRSFYSYVMRLRRGSPCVPKGIDIYTDDKDDIEEDALYEMGTD